MRAVSYNFNKSLLFGLAAFLISAICPVYGQVVERTPEELERINVIEHSGEEIPLNFEFIDDNGDTVLFEQYFNQGKPVVLILGYYTCPMLCNLVMNGVGDALRQLAYQLGRDFQMVSVSIDPSETDLLAKAKKKNYIKDIGKPGLEKGWAMLVGKESQSQGLSDAVGFKYFYDEKRQEYAHPAVLIIFTEDGRISRYLYGIEFKENDLRMALLEASEGTIGSTLDKIILYCYHYDPEAGSYVPFAGNMMKLGGAVTLGLMIFMMTVLWLKDKRRSKAVRDGLVTGA